MKVRLRSPMVVLTALAAALAIATTWPLALDLSGQALDGAYWGVMAWSVRAFPEALWAGELPDTRLAGFPLVHDARYLGGVVLLAALVLEPLIGAPATLNLSLLASPVLCAVVMGLWLRRLLPQASPWSWGLASLGYAFSPHFIANLGNAEAAKAQFWLVPLSLLLAEKVTERWRWLGAFALAALAAAFTEPYGYLSASLALPALALFRGALRQARRWGVMALVWALAGLLARTWFSPDIPAWDQLFAPALSAQLATEQLDLPFSSAPLKALFWPWIEAPPGGTHHGVFLGWSLGLVAALGLRGRRDRLTGLALALLAVGVLSALGPLLFLDRQRPTGVWLPMMLMELLGQPFGSMYYRFLHVALLGLALLVARSGLGPGLALPAGLLALIELSFSLPGGLPLAVAPLPWPRTAAAIRADTQPGAVMSLPAYPAGSSVKEWAFRFSAAHERPITDLPRWPSVPSEWPPMAGQLDRCFNDPFCQVPPDTAVRLEDRGVRVLVLREGGGAWEMLRDGLSEQLGPPTCEDDLCAWFLDAKPPEQIPRDRPRPPPLGPR